MLFPFSSHQRLHLSQPVSPITCAGPQHTHPPLSRSHSPPERAFPSSDSLRCLKGPEQIPWSLGLAFKLHVMGVRWVQTPHVPGPSCTLCLEQKQLQQPQHSSSAAQGQLSWKLLTKVLVKAPQAWG